jgi:hypothetical protein
LLLAGHPTLDVSRRGAMSVTKNTSEFQSAPVVKRSLQSQTLSAAGAHLEKGTFDGVFTPPAGRLATPTRPKATGAAIRLFFLIAAAGPRAAADPVLTGQAAEGVGVKRTTVIAAVTPP